MASLSVVVLGVLGLATVTGTVAIFALAIIKGINASAEYSRDKAKVRVNK